MVGFVFVKVEPSPARMVAVGPERKRNSDWRKIDVGFVGLS